MLVTGTGFSGAEAWTGTGGFQEALLKAGHPSCYVDFPRPHDRATCRSPSSTSSTASAARPRLARSRIAVYGISQGGVLPRHGAHVLAQPAPPGQRRRRRRRHAARLDGRHAGRFRASRRRAARRRSGSRPSTRNLLKWVNRRADETPGPTAWTTVRTEEDEVVTPQDALYPTSSLRRRDEHLDPARLPRAGDDAHRRRATTPSPSPRCAMRWRAAGPPTSRACPPTSARRPSPRGSTSRRTPDDARRLARARGPAPARAGARAWRPSRR